MPTLPVWTDLNPVIDGWSGKKNMLIPYRTLIDTAFKRKLAYNTSHNYGKCQEVILAQELLPRLTEKSFDIGRDWTNAYVQMIWVMSSVSVLNFPLDVSMTTEPSMLYGILYTQMTDEYQPWLGIYYKYIAGGGFKLYNNVSNADYRISGTIIKMRKVTGTGVIP